ncbi:MAG: patatin-like phospholipase family protein [Ideonella sp.]|nr:patatin-like phospholipase family protein [Ideonella sp.]
MTAFRAGADESLPDPVLERPPEDQFCDLVLNGGVASGVVYPWALLELARHYRFKNIGGNSVGAMAAAMAAAAEFGRCEGYAAAFEPLRRMPLELAKEESSGSRQGPPTTKMLRLFQPKPNLSRLFRLFIVCIEWARPQPGEPRPTAPTQVRRGRGERLRAARFKAKRFMPRSRCRRLCPRQRTQRSQRRHRSGADVPRQSVWRLILKVSAIWPVWAVPPTLLGFVVFVQWWLLGFAPWEAGAAQALLLGFATACASLLFLGWRFWADLRGMADNGWGLCTGLGEQPGTQGLVEWLHEGIQRSAGRDRDQAPLTFDDLWSARRSGEASPVDLPLGQRARGIDLQMFCSNVTQGRPVRLPLNDSNTRLYYREGEWANYFPPSILSALRQASQPYMPRSGSDPSVEELARGENAEWTRELRELPSGGMPIAVAARLSLCFPVLFSMVPVYAVDYEDRVGQRRLRRCWLSDGGLCTNFPIHLFDSAHPRWPTFGLQLDSRLTAYEGEAVWLPARHLDGRGDNWQRFVPGLDPAKPDNNVSFVRRLFGVAGGMLLLMKDWNDRVTTRLPQVRGRVVRMALKSGEGQVNINMPGATILRMARVYGTASGKKLVRAFAPDSGRTKRAWQEHLYVRAMVELNALYKHLSGYSRAVVSRGSTRPLREVLAEAALGRPLDTASSRDRSGDKLTPQQVEALGKAISAVERLEAELSATRADWGPYQPSPDPELRLRPPL